MMEKALFLNGVFDEVLEEIIKSQEQNPGKIFYLQPYSGEYILQLKKNPPEPDSPIPLYLSTASQINNIFYRADIVGWDDKNALIDNPERLTVLNEHIKKFQPKEYEIYFEMQGKKCANLISIRNLRKLVNQHSISILKKISNGEPLKPRTRSGRWSYVYALPLLSIDTTYLESRLDEELEESTSVSLKDDKESLKKRLSEASKFPEKVQTISYGFRRNPDVIAFVLKRANGKCELCGSDAPFIRASDNTPYLEIHHWITLSDGGEDSIENAAALCPNCHKQAHFGQTRDFIRSTKSLPL